MFSLNSWAAESIQAQSIDSIRQYYQIKINYRQASIDEKLRARDEVLNILSLYRKENPFDADIAAAEIHLDFFRSVNNAVCNLDFADFVRDSGQHGEIGTADACQIVSVVYAAMSIDSVNLALVRFNSAKTMALKAGNAAKVKQLEEKMLEARKEKSYITNYIAEHERLLTRQDTEIKVREL